MQPREEAYHLHEGQNRLCVHSDNSGYASALFVNGEPVVLRWPDCQGSIGEEFFLASPLQPKAIDLRSLVSSGFADDRSLAPQILPLLQQFPGGEYTISLQPLQPDDWIIWCRGNWSPPGLYTGGYPDDGYAIIFTQPEGELDTIRVFEWVDAIEKGARPIAITAGGASISSEFVLDGHHKLLAYQLTKIPAWRLCIRMVQPAPLRFQDWPQDVPPPSSWKEQML